MKQRIDLQTLLRKYQNNYLLTNIDTHNNHPTHHKYTLKSKLHKVKTEANFYPTLDHYYNTKAMRSPPKHDPFTSRQNDHLFNLNFQMSKSECEHLLVSMREELKNQQRSIQGFIVASVEESIDKFEKVHQQLRMELLNLIEQSLDINRKMVLEYFTKLKTQQSREYAVVYKKIGNIDSDLARLLAGLNGNDYKKTIAQVVTKDYFQLLKTVRTDITSCNNIYRDNLSIPMLDRSKIKHIQDSLQNIYQVSQARREMQDKNMQQLDLGRLSRRSSKKKIFESRNNNNKLVLTDRDEQKKQGKQMRRTFFNFDQEY